jgi:hypothetical protein
MSVRGRLVLGPAFFVLFVAPGWPSAMQIGPRRCGGDLWDIKTLSDGRANKVIIRPSEKTTVAELRDRKRPALKRDLPGMLKKLTIRYELEFRTFTVRALLVGYKLELDGDFHVVIADPDRREKTMIVEIPDPLCPGAIKSGHVDEYQSARATIIHLLGPYSPGTYGLLKPPNEVFVTITGVAFYDVGYKKITGMAPNGLELHPVLSIDL